MAKKHPEHGAHGGAWKVAYADFVTAMMAFFIVMWILASSAETKAAVAAYFRHPSIFKSGGNGFLTEEGMIEYKQAVERIRMETGSTAAPESEEGGGLFLEMGGATAPSGVADSTLADSARALEIALDSSEGLRTIADHVSVGLVPEGISIQIADVEGDPLFESGSATLTPSGQAILATVARVLSRLHDPLLVGGHTDARAYGQGEYTNWELSSDRANATRRALEAGGVDPLRIGLVVGYADRHLLDTQDPTSPRNRRISITVCRAGYVRPPMP